MKNKNIKLGLIISAILLLAFLGYNYTVSSYSVDQDFDSYTNYQDQNDNKNNSNTNKDFNQDTSEYVFVYETEVDSEKDCSKYEIYNPKNKTCYFECSTEEECASINKSIEDELSSWLSDDSQATSKVNESPDDIEKKIVSDYNVSPGERISLIKGKDVAESNTIWKNISNISPNSLSDKYIEEFVIFDDKNSDTLAFVDDADQNGKWRIAVNLAGYNSSTVRERTLIIVHELGHILTLNGSQIKSDIAEESCKNYFTAEGCTEAASYLNSFVKRFWSESDIAKAVKQQDVYFKNKFVTEYAASGPEEDLAESFAYYVIDNNTEGGDIKNQKVAFFANYPELIKIREEMRSGIYSDLIRSRRAI